MPRAYDVVVVGGGSAGCVVAGVLAERGASVALIEAGPLGTPELHDPTRLPIGPNSRYAESLSVELTRNRTAHVSRGRVLGGSGAVNGAYFLRARAADFDAWPDDWTADVAAHYYRHVEQRMPVSSAVRSEIATAFRGACAAAGFTSHADLNHGGDGDGFGAVSSNIDGGRRVSTSAAFVDPVRSRIEVRENSAVARVMFDGSRAVGVEGVDGCGHFTVRAGTVVLAAGAVRSTVLLMHSGIGEPEMLRRHGIEVRQVSSGVGDGVRDHPEVAVPYRPRGDALPGGHRALELVLQTGDLEIRPYSSSFETMIDGLPPSDPMVGVALMRPESRGRIGLTSSNPFAPPRIEYRYLESARDRAELERGVDTARELLAATKLVDLAAPAPLEQRLGTSIHLSASARMGDGAGSVVDSRCAVHGTENLYVVDSSVFPDVPSRGPHATVVMAALRTADRLSETGLSNRL